MVMAVRLANSSVYKVGSWVIRRRIGCILLVTLHETYIALGQSRVEPQIRWAPYQNVPGVNHLAYEVDDVEALRKRMTAAGYRDSTVPNAHPFRKRVYFYDPEGNDWEFVQYLSQDPAERNDYNLPDR